MALTTARGIFMNYRDRPSSGLGLHFTKVDWTGKVRITVGPILSTRAFFAYIGSIHQPSASARK